MNKTTELIDQSEKFSARNYNPLPVVLEKGEGIWVYDSEGKKYMDMLSAYSALNQGHRHPKIIKALIEQASEITLTSRAFYNDKLGTFLEKLCNITGFEKALPMNTGAEAVETAVKAARKWGYLKKGVPENQAEIIVCENNFAGRTISLISFSTEDQYRFGFGPFTPGFKVVPFGDVEALKQNITKNTVAFLLEPIQGEGGVIVPPEGYLKEIREITKENNVLLIFDEIQTGLGRTGKMFAHEYEAAKPDIMTLGKALGGGCYPVSAMLSNNEVMQVYTPGDHGSTFGGNPLAAAVGIAALDVLIDENLVQKAFELGKYFMDKLKEMNYACIKDIRGKGLMIGVEIKKEFGLARPYCEKLMELGILCKETHHQTIRFAPPLIITKQEIDWALDIIEEVLK